MHKILVTGSAGLIGNAVTNRLRESGHKDSDNRLFQAKFECKVCGYKDNADINAAKNILVVGQTMLACGVDTLVATMKQESVGNRESILS